MHAIEPLNSDEQPFPLLSTQFSKKWSGNPQSNDRCPENTPSQTHIQNSFSSTQDAVVRRKDTVKGGDAHDERREGVAVLQKK